MKQPYLAQRKSIIFYFHLAFMRKDICLVQTNTVTATELCSLSQH